MESNLITHAKRELDLAGLFDKDSDYDGMLGKAALELVETFAGQGHSGLSAFAVIDITQRLLSYEPLTPLTSNSSEWNEVSDGLWQSARKANAFSTDGGKTYKVNGSDEIHTTS